jgi:hypothetical protein
MHSERFATVFRGATSPATESIRMRTITTPLTPLLAALALVLATTACQQRTDDTLDPPRDDAATVPPAVDPADTMAPPVQEVDPCAGLMGTELDECLRRQSEMMAPPPVDESQPLPPPEPQEDPATPPPPPR